MMRSALTELRYFLLDMDGTIYLGPNPIPGAPEFIRFLRDSGRRYLFFTNNPSGDARQYSDKLSRMGIEATPDDILTAGEATARYLISDTDYRRVYVLGTPSFENELRCAGLELVDKEPDAVILAFDKTLTYEKLEKACLWLRDGAPYIATNPDAVCPTEYGYIPDCGAMAALLETATGRTPKYIGKPNAEMARMGMAKIDAHPSATAMVGDRIYTDMEMAHRARIQSILVLSGESTRDDLQGLAQQPTHIFDSVCTLQAALQQCGG